MALCFISTISSELVFQRAPKLELVEEELSPVSQRKEWNFMVSKARKSGDNSRFTVRDSRLFRSKFVIEKNLEKAKTTVGRKFLIHHFRHLPYESIEQPL